MNLPTKVSAYSISDYWTCKGVDDSDYPYKPIQPTNTFYITDEQISLLMILENVVAPHTTISRWFDPSGNLFDTIQIDVSDPKKEGFDSWETFSVDFYLFIKGHDMEKLPGQWKIKVYIDGQLKFTESFEIVTQSAPTVGPSQTVTETVEVPGPRNTITKTVTVTSTPQEEPEIDYWTFSNPLLPISIIIAALSTVMITILAMSRRAGRY